MEIVKLQFTSPLHLSRGKSTLDESFDVLHSDTLKSALFVCALELFGEGEILRGGDGKDFFEKFTISSAFPYINNELFFPKPELLPEGFFGNIERKKAKKIEYLNQLSFEGLLKGELIVLEANKVFNKKYYSNQNLTESQPYKSDTVQRVTVSRTFEDEGDTFYTELLYFTEGCGLYFIIDIKDESYRSILEGALRLLGDNGIGSDKSVGNGQFQFHGFEQIDFEIANLDSDKQIALSLYCPCHKKDKIQDQKFLNESAYKLIKRGGYIANPDNFNNSTLRKKSIVMFQEGAVFSNDRVLEGVVVNLKPDKREDVKHPIWRDGRALFLPYNLKENA